jgi:tetratricopeptide (TPR) repeat protein
MLQKNKEKPEAFVTAIFEYTGYFRQEEIQETERLVRVSADVSLVEKQKARADYFLESRRYVLAMQEYRNLLQDGDALAPDFSGKIYHNLGTAQAKLFLFEKAAASFEQAYRLTGDPESLFQYLAAMRLHLKEPEYLNFLTEHAEYYEASLELEKRVVARKEAWVDSRNQSMVAEILRRGFIYYDWNVSAGDASADATTQGIIDNVVNGVRLCWGPAFVLMHDNDKAVLGEALGPIIDTLSKEGYVFKALDNSVKPPMFIYPD